MSNNKEALFRQLDATVARPKKEDLFKELDRTVLKKEPTSGVKEFAKVFGETNVNLNKKLLKGAAGLYDFLGGLVGANPETIKKLEEMGVDFTPIQHRMDNSTLGELAQSAENVVGHGAEWLGGTVAGMPLGLAAGAAMPVVGAAIPTAAKTIPYLSKGIEKGAKILPELLGNPKTLTEAAKMAGIAGALGSTAGLMIENEANPLVADVAASLIPAAYKKGLSDAEKRAGRVLEKFIGEENVPGVIERLENAPTYQTGYEPTIAEIAENPGLASLHRAEYEIPGAGISEHMGKQTDKIREALAEASTGNISDTQEAIAKRINQLAREEQKAIENIGPEVSGKEAGAEIRRATEKEYEARKAFRRAETKEGYERLKERKAGVPTPNADLVFSQEMKYAKGDVRKALEDAAELLIPNEKTPKLQGLPLSEKFLKAHPELNIENLETAYGLKSAAKQIASKIKKAKISEGADSETALVLKRYRSALLKDLAEVPEEMALRAHYRELSPQVEKIGKHRLMGEIIKKKPTGIYSEDYKLTESEIPELFLSRSEKSIDHAKDFLKEVGHDKEMLETMRYDLNRRAIGAIVDKQTGRVNVRKIDAFKKAHPGIQVLYPELFDVKLKNATNAQILANRYYRDAEKVASHLQLNELNEYVPGSIQGMPGKIFNNNSENNIKGLLKATEGNEVAREGLRKLSIDHLMDSIQNAGAEGKGNVLSKAKMNRFMKQHEKALGDVLSPEQMGLTKEVQAILEGQNYAFTKGASKGSPTEARKIIRKTIGEKISFIPENLRWLTDWAYNRSFDKTMDVLHKSLIDEEIALKIMKGDFKGPTQFQKYLTDVGRMSLSTLSQRAAEEEE